MFGIGELIVSAAAALASSSKPKGSLRANPGAKDPGDSSTTFASDAAGSKLATSGTVGRSLHTTA
jgi:hypothetical protein